MMEDGGDHRVRPKRRTIVVRPVLPRRRTDWTTGNTTSTIVGEESGFMLGIKTCGSF